MVSHRLPMIFHTSSYLGEHLPLRAWASSWWRRADPESSPVRHPENVKVGFLPGPETYYWGLGVGPETGPETCGGGTGNGTGKLGGWDRKLGGWDRKLVCKDFCFKTVSGPHSDVYGPHLHVSGHLSGPRAHVSGPHDQFSNQVSGPHFHVLGQVSGQLSGQLSGRLSGRIKRPVSGWLLGQDLSRCLGGRSDDFVTKFGPVCRQAVGPLQISRRISSLSSTSMTRRSDLRSAAAERILRSPLRTFHKLDQEHRCNSGE